MERRARKGQSLIEAMIALGLLVVFIGGAVGMLSAILKVSSSNESLQASWFLNQSIEDVATALTEGNWVTLQTFAQNAFTASDGWFSVDFICSQYPTSPGCSVGANAPVVECIQANVNQFYTIDLEGNKYRLCYKIEKVFRNSENEIDTSGSGHEDYSTLKISVRTQWGDTAQYQSPVLEKYVTRHGVLVFRQTDWSGGATIVAATDDPKLFLQSGRNKFFNQVGIDFTTHIGEVTNAP